MAGLEWDECVCVLGVEGVAWDLGGGCERGWGFGKGREGATMEMRSRRLKGTTIPTIPEWRWVETATPSSCEIFHTESRGARKVTGCCYLFIFIFLERTIFCKGNQFGAAFHLDKGVHRSIRQCLI